MSNWCVYYKTKIKEFKLNSLPMIIHSYLENKSLIPNIRLGGVSSILSLLYGWSDLPG